MRKKAHGNSPRGKQGSLFAPDTGMAVHWGKRFHLQGSGEARVPVYILDGPNGQRCTLDSDEDATAVLELLNAKLTARNRVGALMESVEQVADELAAARARLEDTALHPVPSPAESWPADQCPECGADPHTATCPRWTPPAGATAATLSGPDVVDRIVRTMDAAVKPPEPRRDPVPPPPHPPDLLAVTDSGPKCPRCLVRPPTYDPVAGMCAGCGWDLLDGGTPGA